MHEKAKMTQVTDADVLEFASLRTGNDIEDLDEDDIADARKDLLAQAADWEFRTAVAAGRAEPEKLSAEDKRPHSRKPLKGGLW